MNDEDLRDLFAVQAMQGYLANGDYNIGHIPRLSYELADAMIKAKYTEEEPEVGITAIKRKYTKKEK